MSNTLTQLLTFLPPDAVKMALVLFLSFLVGLEREEHKIDDSHFGFGGVRTFPLIGLLGYALALVSDQGRLPVAVGFAVIGGFGFLSYWHKLASIKEAGITTEVSALGVYVVGALVFEGRIWIACTLVVLSVLLLELKVALEGISKRIPVAEVFTFTKFLLLTMVILPIVPHQDLGRFRLNPFKTWLAIVAVSSVSYGSYVVQKLTKDRGGVFLSAVLGGAYSSTVTTVVLARQSKTQARPHLFAGSILAASGIMYLRLVVLVALFNRSLFAALALPFAALSILAIFGGWLWTRRSGGEGADVAVAVAARNPLELRAALIFGALFVLLLVVTQFAVTHLGTGGVYTLAGIMGVSDVDPFIMGLTQTAGASTQVHVAADAIVIAAASNNVMKAAYAFALAERRTALGSTALVALAALGLSPLLWL